MQTNAVTEHKRLSLIIGSEDCNLRELRMRLQIGLLEYEERVGIG